MYIPDILILCNQLVLYSFNSAMEISLHIKTIPSLISFEDRAKKIWKPKCFVNVGIFLRILIEASRLYRGKICILDYKS